MNTDLNAQYVENGLIYVPRIIEPSRIPLLRIISEHCLSVWRTRPNTQGKYPWVGSNVMRHLNHPGYYPGRRDWLVEVLNLIADPRILDIVRETIADDVVFRSISLFMNPLANGTDGHWHRDSQFFHPDPENEKAHIFTKAQALAQTRRSPSIQLQIALIPSDHSQFVPGSHRRWDTDEELYIRLSHDKKYVCSNLMPGATVTHQEPGDAAAFNPMGIHRGHYRPEIYRRTLMLTFRGASQLPLNDEFTDQPWCLEPGYLDGVKPETKAFFERFNDMHRNFMLEKKSEPCAFLPVF